MIWGTGAHIVMTHWIGFQGACVNRYGPGRDRQLHDDSELDRDRERVTIDTATKHNCDLFACTS